MVKKADTIKINLDLEITKKWVPAFLGFLDKLNRNSSYGHSSLIAFYADGDKDFGFKARIRKENNPDLLKDFGWTNDITWIRDIDPEKAKGKPICKDVDCPALWCNKIEEVYDAE